VDIKLSSGKMYKAMVVLFAESFFAAACKKIFKVVVLFWACACCMHNSISNAVKIFVFKIWLTLFIKSGYVIIEGLL
jgi:hypothetical protein